MFRLHIYTDAYTPLPSKKDPLLTKDEKIKEVLYSAYFVKNLTLAVENFPSDDVKSAG